MTYEKLMIVEISQERKLFLHCIDSDHAVLPVDKQVKTKQLLAAGEKRWM